MKYVVVQNYLVWYLHSETEMHHGFDNAVLDSSQDFDNDDHAHFNWFEDIVMDAASSHIINNETCELPNTAV